MTAKYGDSYYGEHLALCRFAEKCLALWARETAEDKLEMLLFHDTPNCQSAFSEASLHDLQNGSMLKDDCIFSW